MFLTKSSNSKLIATLQDIDANSHLPVSIKLDYVLLNGAMRCHGTPSIRYQILIESLQEASLTRLQL